jgi:hypothetical protein
MQKIRERPEQQTLTRASRDSADRSEIDQQSVTILRITPPCIYPRTREHCYSSQLLPQSRRSIKAIPFENLMDSPHATYFTEQRGSAAALDDQINQNR